MNEIILDRFEISTRTESGRTYAVVRPTAPDDGGMLNYQVKMLRYNPRPEIISFETVMKNGQPEILYDISDLKPIGAFVPDDFPRLVRETAIALSESGKLLLFENSFIFDERHIYADASTGELRFIYLPFEISAGADEELRRFIRRLQKMCFGDDACSNLPLGLEDILNDSGPLVPRLLKISNFKHGEPDAEIDDIGCEETMQNEIRHVKGYFELPVGILSAIWAAAEITLFGSAYFIYKEYIAGLPSGTEAAALILAACALGAGILLARFLLPWFRPEREKDALQIIEDSFFMPEETAKTAVAGNYETVVLGKTALLKAIITTDAHEYELENERCVVGRNLEFADIHFTDMTVGRMHAEILKGSDDWRIRDLGSRNGTKVNGETLKNDEARVLADKDVLEFADSRCVFNIRVRE